MGLAEPRGAALCLGSPGSRSGSWRPSAVPRPGGQELRWAGQDELQRGGLGVAPGPFLILRPVRHKSTNLPSSPQAWPWGERRRGWSSPRCLCAGSAEWGLAGTWCLHRRTHDQPGGWSPPAKASSRRPPSCTRQHPKRRSMHSARPSAVSPSGPLPGALSPGPPLLHCVRAWGLRSRYTYSFCLCAIISVSGGAGWSWGLRGRQRPPPPGSPQPGSAAVTTALPVAVQFLWCE